MIKIEENDIEYLLKGLSFFATGGGGLPERGRKRLLKALDKGINIYNENEIDEDSYVLCTFYMGTASPDTDETRLKRKKFGFNDEIIENPIIEAVNEIEKFTGIDVSALISLETGAGATSGTVSAASILGKKAIDGDYAGRAVPEIYQTTPYLFKKSFIPMAAVDRFGNVTIIKEAKNVFSLERIGKMISESSYTSLGMAGILLPFREVKEIYIPNTISRALMVGRILSKENSLDELRSIVKYRILFRGKLVKREWIDNEGYMEGYHYFIGKGEYNNKSFKIWFRNENHIGFLDNNVVITSPDLITVLNERNEPLNNTSIHESEEVKIIGIVSDNKMRSKEAIDILGPRHFGFDFDYVPF